MVKPASGFFSLLCAAPCLLGWLELATAGPRHHAGLRASPVFRQIVRTVGGPVAFRTADLRQLATSAPDTFLVVKDLESGATRFNDDCSGAGRASCVEFDDGNTVYQVTVFASAANAFGTTDVFVNDSLLANDAEFGGTIVQLVPAELPLPIYVIRTSHLPNGADDTFVVLFDSRWNEKGFDDDSGAGESVSFTPSDVSEGDRLLVASWAPSTQGFADLMVDDCLFDPLSGFAPVACQALGNDHDRDNLSNALEAELGTDPASFDTDRDGILDYHEVYGRGEEELRPFGADPLHRDLFVEFDRKQNLSLTPSEFFLERMRRTYRDLPNLVNPDQTTGIEIHIDSGDPCSDVTLCGDWGGHDVLLDSVDAAAFISDFDQVRQAFDPDRRGVYHYGLLTEAGGGQSSGIPAPTFWAEAGIDGQDPSCTASHELGHNLGLQHWGAPDELEINNEANYPSLMNYNYQCRLWPLLHDRSRFSEGRLEPIDSNHLDELDYSPGVEKSHLAEAPFHYPMDGDWIDFNFDGRMLSPVAFDTSPLQRFYTGKDWPDVQIRYVLGDRSPTGGPSLAVMPRPWILAPFFGTPPGLEGFYATLWAFAPFEHPDGRVYPDLSRSDDNVPGEVVTWSPWVNGVPLDGLPEGEVTALGFDFSFGFRILLLFPDSNGVLQWLLLDPTQPAQGSWAPVPGWPAGTRARNVSAAAVGDRIELIWRDVAASDEDPHLHATNLDRTGVWRSSPVLESQIRSYFTPGLTEAPDGNLYLATVRTSLPRRIVFHRRAVTGEGDWEEVQELGELDSFLAAEDVATSMRRRVTLLFLPYRRPVGSVPASPFPHVRLAMPLEDGSGHLAAYWNAATPPSSGEAPAEGWLLLRAYSAGWISPTGSSLAPSPGWHAQKQLDRPFGDHSPSVVRRWADAAALFTGSNFGSGVSDAPIHQPYASGISTSILPVFSSKQTDTDDAAVIDDSMCESVWRFEYGSRAACFCETLDPTCS